MTRYFSAKYTPKKVLMLYHRNGEEDVYADYFKKTFDNSSTPFQWIELTNDIDSSYFKVEKYLSPIDNNLIIIPSFDEVFINVLTKQLSALSDNYKITVFGLPTWTEMESLRTDYLESVNTHITNSFYVNDSSAAYLSFKKKYFSRFKSLPVDYTIQGYDLMLYMGSLMLQYPDKWREQIEKTNMETLGDRFEIKPSYSQDSLGEIKVQFQENKSVRILKYANNKLVKVN
jgi:hypothetical protein